MLCDWVVEEVGWLDIAVQYLVFMHAFQRGEKRSEIDGNVGDCHVPEVSSEVTMAEVRKDGHNLVSFAKSGN